MREFKRALFIALGVLFVGIGWLGTIVPGLPTIVFLIISLGCFTKSSPRLHSWLYNHRLFGRQLQLWDKYRVIPLVAKVAAIISMLVSSIYLIFIEEVSLFIIGVVVIFMLAGVYYILTKPSHPPD